MKQFRNFLFLFVMMFSLCQMQSYPIAKNTDDGTVENVSIGIDDCSFLMDNQKDRHEYIIIRGNSDPLTVIPSLNLKHKKIMETTKIPADKVEHNLKQYSIRKDRVFPFDEIAGKKYPYFTKEAKKYYFIHPQRQEFNLTDDQVTQLYADKDGKFNPLKSSLFEPAKTTPPIKGDK